MSAGRRDFLKLCALGGLTACSPTTQNPSRPTAPRREINPVKNTTHSFITSAPAPEASAPPGAPELPLFKHFPGLQSRIPHVRLGALPTPAGAFPRLGEKLGLSGFFVKRDDLCGDTYGGSKIRKLEFLLAEAIHSKSMGVITFGAAGSNHAVATALYAQRLQLRCTLLLLPQPPSADIRHKLLVSHHLGARIQMQPALKTAQRTAARMVREQGVERPFYIAESGGSSPIGNLGLVNAAFELKAQIEAGLLPEPDFIYMALGTMGSAVGLMIGLKAAGLKSVLIPVRASSLDTSDERQFLSMFDATVNELCRAEPSFPRLRLAKGDAGIEGRYLGGGYGIATQKGKRAAALFQEETGIELEQTYTAKTLAALMENGSRMKDKSVLFWNTFGSKTISIEMPPAESLPKEIQPFFQGAPAAR